MASKTFDPFGARKLMDLGNGPEVLYALSALEESHLLNNPGRLPYSIRILLEAVLRACDGAIVTEDIAETYGIREGTGARVASLASDGPAAKAGILQDDVIVRFDGKDVTSMRGLPRLVSQTQIGKEVEVEVSRKGQRRTFRVTIGRLAEDIKPTTKAGVRVPPKSRSKGKEKDEK